MNLLHPERHPGHFDASKWLPGAVLFVCIFGLIMLLSSALNDARDLAEEQMVRVTLRNMHTGMQIAKHEAITYQRGESPEFWQGSNPIRWLDTPPQNYRGDCPTALPVDLPENTWCFDKLHSELIFRPRRPQSLINTENPGESCYALVWRVMRHASSIATPSYKGFDGFDIMNVGTCRYNDKR